MFIALIRNNTVDMDTKIKDCHTIADLTALERLNTLSETEQGLCLRRKWIFFSV